LLTAFYSGARGVLMVLNHMAERGDLEKLNRTIGPDSGSRSGRSVGGGVPGIEHRDQFRG